MDTLNVELGTRSYPILIDAGLIGRPDVFRQHLPAHDVLVVSNTTVAPLYLPALTASLGPRRIVEVILPDGEVLTSDSTLRFREREEVEAELAAHGYVVEDVRDAPDRPGRELVFVARRP